MQNIEAGSGIFIQVGAGAGDLDVRANCRDGFTEFIKNLPRDRIQKIILVEPNPFNIPLLRECWKDYANAIIYECGIVPKSISNEYIEMYYCPDDAPHFQVASIVKEHVQKHYGNDCKLEKIVIPTQNLETLCKGEEIELLALDIEGIDADVILDLDFDNIRVKYLSFEHIHLEDKKTDVIHHLESNHFEYRGVGVDHNGFDYLFCKK